MEQNLTEMTTPTQKQLCIAEQLFYGLKVECGKDNITPVYLIELNLISQSSRIGTGISNSELITDIKPILRPMSDLCKEITHKGYNDDKPFMPIHELAKICNPKAKWILVTYGNEYCLSNSEANFGYDKQSGMFYLLSQYDSAENIYPNQNKFIDLLNLWHFDRRNLISSGDAIDVNTLSVNPYEI